MSQADVPPDVADALQSILGGTYSRRLASFDEQVFLENWHLPFFVLFGFLRRYIKMDYTAGAGDLVMSMVAAEIWLFNIGRRLARDMSLPAAAELASEEARRALLPKCNAYSISLGLGIPPETVRRKVKKLVAMGWVERSRRGELHITAACEAVFAPESNLETMRDFASTARVLFGLMGLDAPPGPASVRAGKERKRTAAKPDSPNRRGRSA